MPIASVRAVEGRFIRGSNASASGEPCVRRTTQSELARPARGVRTESLPAGTGVRGAVLAQEQERPIQPVRGTRHETVIESGQVVVHAESTAAILGSASGAAAAAVPHAEWPNMPIAVKSREPASCWQATQSASEKRAGAFLRGGSVSVGGSG